MKSDVRYVLTFLKPTLTVTEAEHVPCTRDGGKNYKKFGLVRFEHSSPPPSALTSKWMKGGKKTS